ncbi:type II secretion system GspH family protein, partial [Patescibacteria group bacterium]|nr:type II secretion system GspH family protein [Patescibacteria group bacterium]
MKIQNSKFKIQNLGFTLVELLIVIALIGILAGAIVATLNPVEQVNKARDAKYDNETAELLAGMERYYASLQTYPWLEMADGPGGTGSVTLETVWGGNSLMCGAGILGTADFDLVTSTQQCEIGYNGKLIDAQEVKPAFR